MRFCTDAKVAGVISAAGKSSWTFLTTKASLPLPATPLALLAAGGALYKFRFLIIQMSVREEKAGDQHRSDCMQRLCCQRVLSLPAANRALSFFNHYDRFGMAVP